MLGWLHITLAIACLVIGAAVFLRSKGGYLHHVLGYLYSTALLLVNVSALFVYQESGVYGAFHVLAVVSLITLSAGFIPAVLRRPRLWWMELHAYFMSWSYVGLVAAGVSQLATLYFPLSPMVVVLLPSAALIVTGALLIHTRVPRIIARFVSRSRTV
ncbi:DUF2306 domain-containing protein [Pseudidiomarina sp. E22-M8]|uniref:DUF2306 domain-containing protein n=1 Tax=Pseudidiomarina sp. E22-M8 TaxID=3424768 RepID=UPI00403D45D6